MKHQPRILIVEDEPSIAELIAVNLRHNGFQPVWAEDGIAAQRELDPHAELLSSRARRTVTAAIGRSTCFAPDSF